MSEAIDRARVFGERNEAVERIAPGFFEEYFVTEHLARYHWASRWVSERTVVDVACGTGYGVSVLRDAGARRVVSLDLSRDALRFGLSRYQLLAGRADAQRLPLGAASCDAVVSLETIEHLENPGAFAKEAARVLRSGGEFLLSTPNLERSRNMNPYHLHEMNLEELESLLSHAGFCIRGIWGQHWGLSSGVWQSIRGLRRLLWQIERSNSIMPKVAPGLKPIYWCLRAVKA